MTIVSYVASDSGSDVAEVIERFATTATNPRTEKNINLRYGQYYKDNGWEWIDLVNTSRRIHGLKEY